MQEIPSEDSVQAGWLHVFEGPLVLVRWTHTASWWLCLAQWALRLLSCSSIVLTVVAAGHFQENRWIFYFLLSVDLDLDPEVTLLVPRISQRFSQTAFWSFWPLSIKAQNTSIRKGNRARANQFTVLFLSLFLFSPGAPALENENKIQTRQKSEIYFFLLLTPKYLTKSTKMMFQPMKI